VRADQKLAEARENLRELNASRTPDEFLRRMSNYFQSLTAIRFAIKVDLRSRPDLVAGWQ
jgi:hypothetical protein